MVAAVTEFLDLPIVSGNKQAESAWFISWNGRTGERAVIGS